MSLAKGTPVPGEPNIKQTEQGTFLVDLYLKNPKTGRRQRRIRKQFRSLAEAKGFRDDTLAQHRLNQLPPAPSEKVSIGRMVELKLASIRENASYEDSARILGYVVDFFGPNRTMESIDEQAVSLFVEHSRRQKSRLSPERTLSNKTVFNHLQHLLGLCRMAKKKNWIACVPEYHFKKKFGKRQITVTLESFLRALEHLPSAPEPDRAMAYMALYTGQRLTDLRFMTWDQVEDSLVRYRSSKTQVDDLHIPDAPPELMTELTSLRHHAISDEHIFANPKSGRPYSPNAIRRHIKLACDKADVPRFTPHQIRHMATTTGLEVSGDPDLVMKWIGWLNPDMIRTTYGHLGNRLGRLMDAMSAEVRELRAQIRQAAPPPQDDDLGNVVTFATLREKRSARA